MAFPNRSALLPKFPEQGFSTPTMFPDKPKRVRWSTYERLAERHGGHGDGLVMHLMTRLLRLRKHIMPGQGE